MIYIKHLNRPHRRSDLKQKHCRSVGTDFYMFTGTFNLFLIKIVRIVLGYVPFFYIEMADIHVWLLKKIFIYRSSQDE